MDANQYQQLAARTLIDAPDFEITPFEVMVLWSVTGLEGETGEVSELVKKGIFHRKGFDRERIKNELGDVLWYLSALAQQFDIPLAEVMQTNIEKLKARYPDGYSAERSSFREGAAK
jgi:NTP pyrophosphatase (non-canonical NTP hydrolase)